MEPLTFAEFLAYLGSPAGSWAVITLFASVALEKWGFWQGLSGTIKRYAMLALAAGLALGIQYLGTQPDILAFVEPIYTWIVTFIGGWLTLEVTHNLYNKRVAG